ncbi:MAG: hypothetical protein LBH62_00005 [Nitrososphaerota archaeon]|nr:hypothetical protein [Nitrososphaerota archaeon]
MSIGYFGGVIISLLQCGTTDTNNTYNCNTSSWVKKFLIGGGEFRNRLRHMML